MARTNTKTVVATKVTYEGARASRLSPIQELRRTALATMLFEDQFYESGQSIADRVAELVPRIAREHVSSLAVEAREKFKLRHMPLYLVRELARTQDVSAVLEVVIQRPDELAEFLALYWKDKKQPLTNSVKKGLAAAFKKFDEYSLAKYNRDNDIKLRDVMRMVHPKPENDVQAALWKRLLTNTLKTPDTWEVELSQSKDRLASWSRLLVGNKLGALALLRNLRNMQQAGVPDGAIRQALLSAKVDRVLPFRFITAARYAPQFEPELEALMFKCLADFKKLPGRTALLVDGSGSMFGAKVSEKSELDRFDAACALAVLAREICEEAVVLVFGDGTKQIAPRRGFALRDAMKAAAEGNGTNIGQAKQVADRLGYDRIIIFTDEQSRTSITHPKGMAKGYIVNVAPYDRGVGYGAWTHVTGFSEATLDFIQASEAESVE